LVILGNPPYSGHSANKGQWIDDLLKKGYTLKDGSKDEGYYAVDGRPLGEKNPKWLQDDYVKFIRFAQWKIDRAGEGILGFISNHSYLDNPTFRGMRQSLMKTFDEIYVLDLHGNTLKKEKCPDGSKDENVFDIRQGVAIALFIKNKGGRKPCTVFHSEIWGLREGKYGWLESNDASTTHWKRLAPKTEYYLYIAREEKLWGKYGRFSKISNIFMIKNTGIITSRDKFVIDFDSVPLLLRIRLISNLKTPEDLVKQTYSLRDVREKTLAESRKEIAEIPQLERYCIDILYRPFDKRKIFYHSSLVRWPVYEVMRHMMGENLALIAPKQFKEQPGAFITTDIIGHKTVSAYDINYIFPLYIYQDAKKKDLFSGSRASSARISNIDQDTGDALAKAYKKEPFPEEILYYIYGILYSNTYRSKYAQFLKLDFPRVPFTKDYALFSKIAELGATLVDLHLMKSKELEQPVTRFLGPGENRVDRVRYEKDRVYINLDQYFEGVEPEVWGYQIGGYQVCDKWLKDRKGRKLSLEEIKHYCKIATALEKTITVQKEIDKLYPNVEENVIDFPESIR
jgi:predicted helicase